jgi:hypothetical protein
MSLSLLSLATGMLVMLSGARATHAPGVCPGETEQARRIAVRFASSSEFARARDRYNVASASPEQVRLLTDSSDADVCRRLLTIYRQRTERGTGTLLPTFYQAGDFYYVSLVREPKPHPARPGYAYIDTRWLPLWVLDRDLRLVASVAM